MTWNPQNSISKIKNNQQLGKTRVPSRETRATFQWKLIGKSKSDARSNHWGACGPETLLLSQGTLPPSRHTTWSSSFPNLDFVHNCWIWKLSGNSEGGVSRACFFMSNVVGITAKYGLGNWFMVVLVCRSTCCLYLIILKGMWTPHQSVPGNQSNARANSNHLGTLPPRNTTPFPRGLLGALVSPI